jgi:hypothetical protein
MKKLSLNELKGSQVLTRSQLRQVVGGAAAVPCPEPQCKTDKECDPGYICIQVLTSEGYHCSKCIRGFILD